MAALIGCAVFAGCQEKAEGTQVIIIELADPEAAVETGTAEEQTGSPPKETVSGEETTEAEPAQEEAAEEMTKTGTDEGAGYPKLAGLPQDVEVVYTQIRSDDPMIGLVTAGILPEGGRISDFEVTDIRVYQDGEEIIPSGEIIFSLDAEPDSEVVLYRLDEDGKLVSEDLTVENGEVSYPAQGCGRWLVLDTLPEQETESVSETDTKSAGE